MAKSELSRDEMAEVNRFSRSIRDALSAPIAPDRGWGDKNRRRQSSPTLSPDEITEVNRFSRSIAHAFHKEPPVSDQE